MALGLLEVFGFTTAVCAADAACKAANVEIVALDSNKPAAGDLAEVPLVMIVKMRGSVSDVKEALLAAETRANQVSGVITKHIIANPYEDTNKMARLCSVGK